MRRLCLEAFLVLHEMRSIEAGCVFQAPDDALIQDQGSFLEATSESFVPDGTCFAST